MNRFRKTKTIVTGLVVSTQWAAWSNGWTAAISWNSHPGAIGYLIIVTDPSNNKTVTFEIHSWATLLLPADNTYNVSVMAVLGEELSRPGRIFVTTDSPPVPEFPAPTDVSLSILSNDDNNTHRVRIVWYAAYSAVAYNIYMRGVTAPIATVGAEGHVGTYLDWRSDASFAVGTEFGVSTVFSHGATDVAVWRVLEV